MLGAPTGPNTIQELNQNELDILYAFLGGRNVGGHLDFQLGRQIHFDLIDFYAFDGADLLYHATRLFGVEAFAGTEVRGTMPLASPIYELDGTSAGSRDPATRPAQNSEIAPLAGAALVRRRAAPVPGRRGCRSARSGRPPPIRLPGEPESGINEEVVSLTATASWRNRIFLSGGAALQLPVRRARRRAAGAAREADAAPVADAGARLPGADLRRRFDLEHLLGRRLPRPARQLRDWPARRGEGLRARRSPASSCDTATRSERPLRRAGVGAEAPAATVRGRRQPGRGLAQRARDAARRRLLGRRLRRPQGRRRRDDAGQGAPADRARGAADRLRLAQRSPATANRSGVVFGAQAGGRYQLGQGVARCTCCVEDNVGTYYESQFRGLAMLELDAAI